MVGLMPSYEYQCEQCQKIVEIYRSFDEKEKDHNCTECGVTLKRKWTATPAIFRGGGWGGSK
jgi:putative FmdB family regulatory protein